MCVCVCVVCGCEVTELKAPRESLKPHAPRVKVVALPPGTKGKLIGTGGVNIKRINATCGAELAVRNPQLMLRHIHTHPHTC